MSNNNLASELVEKVFQTNHSQGNCNFYDCRRKIIAAVKKIAHTRNAELFSELFR